MKISLILSTKMMIKPQIIYWTIKIVKTNKFRLKFQTKKMIPASFTTYSATPQKTKINQLWKPKIKSITTG